MLRWFCIIYRLQPTFHEANTFYWAYVKLIWEEARNFGGDICTYFGDFDERKQGELVTAPNGVSFALVHFACYVFIFIGWMRWRLTHNGTKPSISPRYRLFDRWSSSNTRTSYLLALRISGRLNHSNPYPTFPFLFGIVYRQHLSAVAWLSIGSQILVGWFSR